MGQSVRIYLDADRTGTKASGVSIEQGIRTALSEVDAKLDGHSVELVIKDHRGNTGRSRRHLEEYLQDEHALAVFAGLHSPPLLVNREFINTNGILLLDPWAAAGPITRYPSKTNWIFRLSVDDTKAGYVIARYAVRACGYKRPILLLEDTGWGKSNEKTMKSALQELGIGTLVPVKWFNWNVRAAGARILLHEINETNADVIFFVANAPEGKTFVRAMASLPAEQRLPICSHWGITGGDFPSAIELSLRRKITLNFIQTRFSFINHSENALGQKVLSQARQLFPQSIQTALDIKAPTGFIHAYDLTKILIAAVEKVGLSGDIQTDRRHVRMALEDLDQPIHGLIRTYVRPFGVFSEEDRDAHEALSIEDFTMAHYGDNGEIILEEDSHTWVSSQPQ